MTYSHVIVRTENILDVEVSCRRVGWFLLTEQCVYISLALLGVLVSRVQIAFDNAMVLVKVLALLILLVDKSPATIVTSNPVQ